MYIDISLKWLDAESFLDEFHSFWSSVLDLLKHQHPLREIQSEHQSSHGDIFSRGTDLGKVWPCSGVMTRNK